MKARLDKKIRDLEKLNNIHNQMYNKTLEKRLDDLLIFDRNKKLFKPVTDSINTQNIETQQIIKNLPQLQNNPVNTNTPAITPKESEPVTRSSDNSLWRKVGEKNNIIELLSINPNQPIAHNLETNEIGFINGEKMEGSIGLSKLLMDKKLNDFNDVVLEDYQKYFDIYKITGVNPGESKRFKSIVNNYNIISGENKTVKDFQIKKNKGKGIEKISNVPTKNEIPKTEMAKESRLDILESATDAGHNNTRKEAKVLLDSLLDKKVINTSEYNNRLKNFD